MSTKTTPRLGFQQDENVLIIASSRLSKPYNNSEQKAQNIRAKHHMGPLYLSFIGTPFSASAHEEHQNQGFTNLKSIPDEVVQISSGDNHVGFLTKSSRVYMMGDNSYGQLGLDGVASPKIPSLQTLLLNIEVAQISCGSEHTFALTTRGEVYSWGLNLKGQLGLGHMENVDRPTLVHSLLPWNRLGNKHKRNLSLITLSHNKNAQIPSASKTPLKQRSNSIDMGDNGLLTEGQEKAVNTLFDQDERVLEVACGALHTLVRTDRNKLFSAGFGRTFALGHGDTSSHTEFKQILSFANSRTSRTPVASGEEIEKIAAGVSHSGCIRSGRAYVWGICGSKEAQKFPLPTQVEVKHGELIVDLQLGDNLTVFQTQKGEVYTMGDNEFGQLGTMDDNGTHPQKVEIPGPIAFTSVGRNHVVAVTEYNQLYGWGLNDNFQLGVMSEDKYFKTPVPLQQFSEVDTLQVVAGSSRTFIFSGKQPLEDNGGSVLRPSNMDNKLQIQEFMKIAQENDNLKKTIDDLRNRMKKMTKDNEKLQSEVAKQQNIILFNNLKEGGKGKMNAVTQTEIDYNDKIETKVSQQRRKKNSRSLSLDIADNPQKVLTPQFEIDFKELVLEKQISEGGYGLIFKGKWRESVVAIKMLKAENMKEESINDFLRECQSMHCLRHPNIVMFLGACTKPPNFAIVLEFCPRGSLWSFLQNLDINLNWEDRKRFALDTAKAMNYLHCFSPAVLHRDLKSLNLLLDDSFRVKLADFGWTRNKDALMTAKIGTYQWMAPEVIMGQQYTEKADVYSFGIILWEMASREPPFRHLSGVQVSLEVVNNDLRPPIPKKTPENWVRVMKKCWDRDPNKRPTFKELIKELESLKFA